MTTLHTVLNWVERQGNRIPHPTVLFIGLCGLVLVLSALLSWFGVSAIHPVTQEQLSVTNLLSAQGIQRILTDTITNYTSFAPLGSVLVAMLGIGIAEKSGLIGSLLKLLVIKAPPSLITFSVVLTGVLSSIAADAGYVVLIPIAGLVFFAAGKHPLAGIAAAFSGVSGGFSANLMIGPVDAILAGMTQEGAALMASGIEVNATANFYFIIASTFVISVVGTLITEKYVIPYLGPFDGSNHLLNHEASTLTSSLDEKEKSGLKAASIVLIISICLLLAGLLPVDGILRNPGNGSVTQSPFIKGIVVVIALIAALCSIAYGKAAKTMQSSNDMVKGMEETMTTMAGYLVLMFFAAQFVAYFNWTHLGLILAIKSAEFLSLLHLNAITLTILFILMAALINLFVGSASAKWAILAPIFVPMFMLLGISPELTQAAYRVGDSSTNIITPLMPYFALVVAFMQRYEKNTGIGTAVALMLPYSIAFLISWSLLLTAWIALDVPLGPGAELIYQLPQN